MRQERLSPAIEEAWKILEKHALDVEKGSMSTVISGEDEKVFGALKEVFLASADKGLLAMVVTFSNACPV